MRKLNQHHILSNILYLDCFVIAVPSYFNKMCRDNTDFCTDITSGKKFPSHFNQTSPEHK